MVFNIQAPLDDTVSWACIRERAEVQKIQKKPSKYTGKNECDIYFNI
jgi:hypothetical protein